MDAKDEPRRAEIAIGDEQVEWLHPRQNLRQQRAFLRIRVLTQHHIGDQAHARFVDHQRLARQAGVEPAPQRRQAMLGAGQHVTVQHAQAIAGPRFDAGARQQGQQTLAAFGASANHRFADGRRQAAELAVNGLEGRGDRRLLQRLVRFVGGMDGAVDTGSDLNHQADQGVEGQFARVLGGGVLGKEFFEGRLVQQPLEGAADHDGQGHRVPMGHQGHGQIAIHGMRREFGQRIGGWWLWW